MIVGSMGHSQHVYSWSRNARPIQGRRRQRWQKQKLQKKNMDKYWQDQQTSTTTTTKTSSNIKYHYDPHRHHPYHYHYHRQQQSRNTLVRLDVPPVLSPLLGRAGTQRKKQDRTKTPQHHSISAAYLRLVFGSRRPFTTSRSISCGGVCAAGWERRGEAVNAARSDIP